MISDDLIDRLSSEVGRRLGRKARIRRIRALSVLAEARVLVAREGAGTWEEVFDGAPTLAELIGRVGPGAQVIRLVMNARRTQAGAPQKLAAE